MATAMKPKEVNSLNEIDFDALFDKLLAHLSDTVLRGPVESRSPNPHLRLLPRIEAALE